MSPGKAGIFENHYGFAQSVGIGDFNNDGWEDIYVCNDFFEDDYLYINQGNKTFVNELPRFNESHIQLLHGQ
jgi:hypothetical protein